MEPPIVFWPRDVELNSQGSYVDVSFRTDFTTLRPDVKVGWLLWAATKGPVDRLSSAGGRHLARVMDGGAGREALESYLSCLTIVFERTVGVDLCLALDWNSIPGTGRRTPIGDVEYEAKWQNDASAMGRLGDAMVEMVIRHALLNTARTVVPVPSTHPCSGVLAQRIADVLGAAVVVPHKADPMVKQSRFEETKDFDEAFVAPRGSIILPDGPVDSPVLIVDDLIQSGGTIAEVARCLRQRGCSSVFAVAPVKAASMFRQT